MEQRVARSTGLGLALLSAATFGTSGAFAATLLQAGWTPGAAVTVRVVTAALALTVPALVVLRRRRARLAPALRSVTAYGLVGVAGCQLAYFSAVQRLSVAVALLLEYSGVLLVVAWLWVRRGVRPRSLTVVGGLAAVAGLALVLDVAGNRQVDAVGVLWGAAAAVGLAVYFVLSAGTEDALPPIVVAWGGLTVGGVALLAAAAAGALPLAAPRTDVTLLETEMSWLVPVLGLSLVAAVVAYVAGIAGARLLGAKLASFVGFTEVLFAVVFAWLLLDQVLTAPQLVGCVLVIAGIALVRVDELRTPRAAAALAPTPDHGVLAADQPGDGHAGQGSQGPAPRARMTA